MKTQLSLGTLSESAIPLSIDDHHPLVQLSKTLPWEEMVDLAKARRVELGRSNRGQETHYRALLGAVIVRSVKEVDYRGAEDLVRNYLPARYLCSLHNSHWTPDHNTIFDFEQMLGSEGLHRLNVLFLHEAQDLGFLDPKSLCSDTTAQEAKIPYPNEVGLMGSFAKSVGKAMGSMGKKVFKVKEKIVEKTKQVAKLVREHRLFAKSKEERLQLGQNMSEIIESMQTDISEYLSGLNSAGLRGYDHVAKKKLEHLFDVMTDLLPQVQIWIKEGRVVKDKIVSLFHPDVRCVTRGKVGKSVEFGLKWGINQVSGYVSLFEMEKMMSHDSSYAVSSIQHHLEIFGEAPKQFGFDRGAWSKPHLEEISRLGVSQVAVAPKGQADWLVGKSCKDKIIRERAQVEGKIGTIKKYGLNKPDAKETDGMRRAARRAEVCFNLKKLQKDLLKLHIADMEGISFA